MNEYAFGQTVTMRADFKVSDVLTDPSSISLEVTSPSGVTTVYTYAQGEVTKDSTGRYSKALACSESGEWVYVWTGTGTCEAVGSHRFAVRRVDA